MGLCEWKDSYSVQVPSMDVQHKKLFSLVDQLYDAMRASKTDEVMKTVLPSLLSYTKTHFAAEEKMLKDAGYPGLAEQQDYHRQFTAKIEATIEKYNVNKIAPSVTLTTFLKDWLTSHIQVKDKQYGTFLAQRKPVGAGK